MFLTLVFFYDIYFFSLMVVFIILSFINLSWGGMFFLVEGSYNYFLILLSLYIFYLVYLSETSFFILYLSIFLFLISLVFFFVYNFLFFYMFFELSLVPILMMIMSFGVQIEKISASYYLLFYSFFTTFPFLYVYFKIDFFFYYVYFDFFMSWEFVFFLTLGFMMKFPVYILHFWLPKAHVESPTSGSMLLAGLLLKFGVAGFVRFLGCVYFVNLYFWIFVSFLSLLVCCFICMVQGDVKSMVAYSSIVHMGFILMCMVVYSLFSKTSVFLMMLAHGYVSVVIFFLVGEFYHMCQTRLVYFFNSFMVSNFFMCFLFSSFMLMNSGCPPSLSFFCEILGIVLFYNSLYFLNLLVMFYFFLSFYYSLFMLLNLFLGKNFLSLSYFVVLFSSPFFFICFNFFMFLTFKHVVFFKKISFCFMLYFDLVFVLLVFSFFYCVFNNSISSFFGVGVSSLKFFMGLDRLSSFFCFFCFFFVLTCCFGGFLGYSFCALCLVNFTFFFSFYFWLSSFICFLSNFKFFIYMSKIGDNFLKTFSLMVVEVVSEFSRPFSLTVRLTVNILVGHMLCFLFFYLFEFFFGFLVFSMFSIIMEFFVFFIQSYIFSRLVFLYLND